MIQLVDLLLKWVGNVYEDEFLRGYEKDLHSVGRQRALNSGVAC